jgi:hypothetical protein
LAADLFRHPTDNQIEMSTFNGDSDYAPQGGLSPETKQASQTNGTEPANLQQTLVNSKVSNAQLSLLPALPDLWLMKTTGL